jgi:hypothetical protein
MAYDRFRRGIPLLVNSLQKNGVGFTDRRLLLRCYRNAELCWDAGKDPPTS